MDTLSNSPWLKKTAAALCLPFAALTFAGCASSGPEEGVTAQDVAQDDEQVEPAEDTAFSYDDDYNTDFYDQYESLMGETVRVSATVNEIISPEAFTIAGTEDTTVEPILVVTANPADELEVGETVAVTGTVGESFNVVAAEEELGIDLEDERFADREGERYITATEVELLPEAE